MQMRTRQPPWLLLVAGLGCLVIAYLVLSTARVPQREAAPPPVVATPVVIQEFPELEARLAQIDGAPPIVYRPVLSSLAAKCAEPPAVVVDSVLAVREQVRETRGVQATALRYLEAVDAAIPPGVAGVACWQTAQTVTPPRE